MTKIACVGITVQDRIYSLLTLPDGGGKYQANHYLEIGGGPAATAAVAIAKLGVRLISSVASAMTVVEIPYLQNLRVGASIPHFAADILTPVHRNQRSSLISMANGLSLIIQVPISVLMPNG